MSFKRGNSFQKETIKDLLTDEEKAQYYLLKSEMYRCNGEKREECRLKASQILLTAVNRELEKRSIV